MVNRMEAREDMREKFVELESRTDNQNSELANGGVPLDWKHFDHPETAFFVPFNANTLRADLFEAWRGVFDEIEQALLTGANGYQRSDAVGAWLNPETRLPEQEPGYRYVVAGLKPETLELIVRLLLAAGEQSVYVVRPGCASAFCVSRA